MSSIIPGIDRLLSNPSSYLKGKKIGMVVNHTSQTKAGEYSAEAFLKLKGWSLEKLFAPEHGLYGVAQDMISVADTMDPATGLKIISLYGKEEASLTPKVEDVTGLDELIFDIQDIGSRYYTFIYTMAHCMETCAKTGTRMVVCDRPNPINGVQVEGNRVGEAWKSFVGRYPLANRHGMTAGELAKMFNEHYGIHCDLCVVPMQGWEREMWFDQTGLSWTLPSPNMPTLATATVYPGMCLIEGTLLSEGRGTTLPFELFGAPFIDAHALAKELNGLNLPGVYFRPHYFQAMFQKCAGQVSGGAQMHVRDREVFRPLLTGLAVIHTVQKMYPASFQWREEPYEFVSDRLAIDLLYGNDGFRNEWVGKRNNLEGIERSWEAELQEFKDLRSNYMMY
ncbi:MAG: hypothetical protein COV66_02550 [Nitrospinae bacterium CG11_big_fil_rev_8_21_14_0_20_45_15]|nr:MAG: hypothetical protein COV66_02550 [Nitrospinae bacterium CG11_big_fil_rev_8_21_14_0_20_45_15]